MSQTDRHLQPNNIVPQLVFQSTQATADQLSQITKTAATAPFAPDLLEVDEPLWGSFWHGDVIAPGYRLPAIELALLRAIRLDRTWSEETDIARFMVDLHQTIRHPQAGIWTMAVANEPCVVFGGPTPRNRELITMVWYCASTGQLHAGYRTPVGLLAMEKAVEHRKPGFKLNQSEVNLPLWLTQIELEIPDTQQSSAIRLDAEILRFRRTGLKQT